MAGADGGAVMNWEIGIDIYTLIGIKWITNKNLLYKKINKIKFKNSKQRSSNTKLLSGIKEEERSRKESRRR